MADFQPSPKVSIFGADQKDGSLWGRVLFYFKMLLGRSGRSLYWVNLNQATPYRPQIIINCSKPKQIATHQNLRVHSVPVFFAFASLSANCLPCHYLLFPICSTIFKNPLPRSPTAKRRFTFKKVNMGQFALADKF